MEIRRYSVVLVVHYLCQSVRRQGSNWREASSLGGKTPLPIFGGN